MIWLLSVDCLDAVDAASTLHFSSGAWDDKTKLIYQNRLLQPALINQSANDGGVLQMFKESSTGEIELANTDGALDFMAGYAFDGRAATLNNGTTSYSLGTVDRLSERGNSIFFSFKSVSETLGNDYPQSAYDSTIDSPAWDTELNGKLIPIVFGKCQNITPVLIDSVHGVYQVSSGTDCRVTAIYYDGQRLTNYKTNGAHVATNTTIAIDSGTKNIATGAQIVFSGDDTIYTVSTGLTGLAGNIVITPGLSANVADNTPFDVINGYASLSALQTDAAKISTDLTKTATKWSSFQGYFHLADAALGVVTCDVITVSGTTPRKCYDVIEDIIAGCGISGLTVDTSTQIIDNIVYGQAANTPVKTVVNTLGYAGYYLNDTTPIKDILDALVKSFSGYWWLINKQVNIKILDYPAATAVVDINDYQIKAISREALGLCSNGIPIKGWLLKYQRNWTVMTTVAGILGTTRKELLGKDYQEIGTNDTNLTTESRHPLSEKITLESLLTSKAAALLVFTQLDAVCSVRRDVVTITSNDLRLLDTVLIGKTINAITPLLGYTAGRKLVCIGVELNATDETILIRAYG